MLARSNIKVVAPWGRGEYTPSTWKATAGSPSSVWLVEPMPRRNTCTPPESPCCSTTRLGTSAWIELKSLACALSRSRPEMAVTASGVSCTVVTRLVAVTVTLSSSWSLSLSCAQAAVPVSSES
jgi:hypothetical protein